MLPQLAAPFPVAQLFDAERAAGFEVVHRERRRVLARRGDTFLWAYLRHGHTVVRTELVHGPAATILKRGVFGVDTPRPAARYGAVGGGPPLTVHLEGVNGDAIWHPRVELVSRRQASLVVSDAALGETDVEELGAIARRCAQTHTVFVARAAASLVGDAREPERVAEVFAGRSHRAWSALRERPESRWLCLTLGEPSEILYALLDAFVFDGFCGEVGPPHTLEQHGIAISRAVSVVHPAVFTAPGGEPHHNHIVERTLLAARLCGGLAAAADGRRWIEALVSAPNSPLHRGRIDGDLLSVLVPHGDEHRWVTLRPRDDGDQGAQPLVVRPRRPRVTLGTEATSFLDERVLVTLPLGALLYEPLSSVGETWRVDTPETASWETARAAVVSGATPELQVARLEMLDAPVYVVVCERTWEAHPITDELGDVVATRDLGELSVSVRSPKPLPKWCIALARHLLKTASPGARQRPRDRIAFAVDGRTFDVVIASGHHARVLIEGDVVLCEIRGEGHAHGRLALHLLDRRNLHLPYVDPRAHDVVEVLGQTRRFRRDEQRGRVVRDAELALWQNRVLYVVSEVEADWEAHREMLESLSVIVVNEASAPAWTTDWDNLYEVDRRLGRGGAAEVHRVRHRGWAMDLAMKRPRADATSADTLKHEAEAWTKLGPHPNVVSCYQARRREGIPHIFVELVEGGTLAEWIEDGRLYAPAGDSSRFSSAETHRQASAFSRMLDIGIQVAHGLHHAHEHGLIHQDVKPANIMLTEEGVAKVTDFGLVKASRTEHEVAVGGTVVATCGGLTPAYCSPEQATASVTGDKLTRRTDIWSWAVMMLEMFNGGVTWRSGALARVVLQELREHGPAESVAPPLPTELAELLDRCLAISASDRPHDMVEVAAELTRIYHHTLGNRYARRPPRPADGRADVLANRGASLMDLAQTEAAVDVWLDARAVEPLHLEAEYNLALHAHRQGGVRFGARMRDLVFAHPGRWEAHHALAWSHVERGDEGAALAAADRARALGAPRREVAAIRAVAAPGFARMATQRIAVPSALRLVGHRVIGFRPLGRHRTLMFTWSLDDNAVVKEELDLRVEHLAVAGDGMWVAGVAHRRGARRQEMRALDFDLDVRATIDVSPWTSAPLDRVTAIAVRADAVWLGRQSGRVEGWHTHKRTLEVAMAHHRGPVTAIALQGGRMATGAEDGRVLVIAGDHVVDVVQVEAPRALRLAGHLLTAVGGRGVTRFDRVRRSQRQIPRGSLCDLSPSGDEAVDHLEPGCLRHWDLRTGRIAREATPRGANVRALAHDGEHVVVAYDDDVAAAYRLAPTSPAPWLVVRPRSSEQLLAEEVAYDDALGEARAALDVQDVERALKLTKRAADVMGFRRSPALFSLRRRIASVTKRGGARGCLLRQVLSTTPWRACQMSADGSYALSLAANGVPAWWRMPSEQHPDAELVDALHARDVVQIALSADGLRALTHAGGELTLWSLRDERELKLGSCARFAVSRSGAWAVVQREVLVALHLDRERERPLDHGARMPTCMGVSPDGDRAVCGFEDGTVTVWELEDTSIAWQRRGHSGAVIAVAIDERGTIVSSGPDGTRRWTAGSSEGELVGSGCPSRLVVREGLVASCGDTTTIWDLHSGEVAHRLDAARDVAFTDDGTCALTCSASGLRMWELDWERS